MDVLRRKVHYRLDTPPYDARAMQFDSNPDRWVVVIHKDGEGFIRDGHEGLAMDGFFVSSGGFPSADLAKEEAERVLKAESPELKIQASDWKAITR